MTSELRLRRLREPDVEAAVRTWGRTKRAAYPWLPTEQAYRHEDHLRFFRGSILVRCEVWLATRADEITALMALEGDHVDQLFVAPEHQGRHIGLALLEHAKSLHREHLSLYTHQRNERARRFYRRNGFVAVRFGISPAPESEPDIRYEWPGPGG